MKAFLVKYTFSSRLHLLALTFLCQTAGVLCETSSALFEQAISDTREMKISMAFEKLEEAYRQEPNLPGLAEYTAWQNYLAGYHDQKTIELFEAALPNSQDPTAVQAALGHLRHELGVENGVAPGPAKRPAQAPPAEQPADRLQYARELYWSGSPEEAKAILQELIGEKADEPLLRLELARVLAALQENSAAADEIQTARFLRP
jgi:predicted Zn-dependent protease